MDKVQGGAVKLNTGYCMPLMGYGTYTLTGAKEMLSGLDFVLKCGYRLIDTAVLYGNEREIGTALKTLLPKHGLSREDVFITTKLDPRGTEEAKQLIAKSIEDLQSNYIDLVLIHFPMAWGIGFDHPNWSDSFHDPINRKQREEIYKVLEGFKDAGKIRSIGVSSYEPRHLDEIKEYSTTVPAVNQCEFHPLHARNAIRDKCKQMGVHFQAFTSLARQAPELVDNATVKEVAKEQNATVAQTLLAFAMCQGVSVIPKSASPARIQANYEAVHVKLTQGQLDRLNGLNKDQPFTPCCGWKIN